MSERIQGYQTLVLRTLGAVVIVLWATALPAAQPEKTEPPKDAAAEKEKKPAEKDSGSIGPLQEAFNKTKTAKTDAEYSEVIELCKRGLDNGATGEAAAYARKLMGWAHNRRGEEYAVAGREDDALKEFVKAIEFDPGHWKALHNRGVSRALKREYKEAMADFDRAIEVNGSYANSWFNRGELYYEQSDFGSAIRDYTQAIRRAPKDAAAYNSRGHAYYRLGRLNEALSDYNEAVRLQPEDAMALTNRGDAYADLGRYSEAANDYKQAIKLNPKLGRAFQSTAWLMATCPEPRYRDPEQAVENARLAIDLEGKNDYRFWDTLAAAQAAAGDFQAAIQAEEKAISMAPVDDAARFQRRLSLYRDGQPYREGPRSAAVSRRGFRE